MTLTVYQEPLQALADLLRKRAEAFDRQDLDDVAALTRQIESVKEHMKETTDGADRGE